MKKSYIYIIAFILSLLVVGSGQFIWNKPFINNNITAKQTVTAESVKELSQTYFLKSVMNQSLDFAKSFNIPITLKIVVQKPSDGTTLSTSRSVSDFMQDQNMTSFCGRSNRSGGTLAIPPYRRSSPGSLINSSAQNIDVNNLNNDQIDLNAKSLPRSYRLYDRRFSFQEKVQLSDVGTLNIFNDFNQFASAQIGLSKQIKFKDTDWAVDASTSQRSVIQQSNFASDLELYSFHNSELCLTSPNAILTNRVPNVAQDKIVVSYKVQNSRTFASNERLNTKYLEIKYFVTSNQQARLAFSCLPIQRLLTIELNGDLSSFWKKKSSFPYGSMTETMINKQSLIYNSGDFGSITQTLLKKLKKKLQDADEIVKNKQKNLSQIKENLKQSKKTTEQSKKDLKDLENDLKKSQLARFKIKLELEHLKETKQSLAILESSTSSVEDKDKALEKINESRKKLNDRYYDQIEKFTQKKRSRTNRIINVGAKVALFICGGVLIYSFWDITSAFLFLRLLENEPGSSAAKDEARSKLWSKISLIITQLLVTIFVFGAVQVTELDPPDLEKVASWVDGVTQQIALLLGFFILFSLIFTIGWDWWKNKKGPDNNSSNGPNTNNPPPKPPGPPNSDSHFTKTDNGRKFVGKKRDIKRRVKFYIRNTVNNILKRI
jgi:hypothetical protein